MPELPEGRTGDRIWRELLVEARYDGYLEREAVAIRRLARLEETEIPAEFDYNTLPGLANEARQKLINRRPATLGQAGRIDGVTPADIALLQIALHRKDGGNRQ